MDNFYSDIHVTLTDDSFLLYMEDKNHQEFKILLQTLGRFEAFLMPLLGCKDPNSSNYKKFKIEFSGRKTRSENVKIGLKSIKCIQHIEIIG